MSFKKKMSKSIALALVGVTIALPLGSSVNAIQNSDKIHLKENVEEASSNKIELLMKKSMDIDTKIKEKVLSMGYKSVEEYNELIGTTIPLEESIYYNNFEYYETPLPETIENNDERAVNLVLWVKATWTSLWRNGTLVNFGKMILSGAAAEVGSSIVNDTREIIKNGFPKIFSHASDNVVGYGRITSGDKVKVAQTLLRQHGYDIAIDGIWGPQSDAATKSFQRKLNMTPDGLIGKHTWAYLIEHLK